MKTSKIALSKSTFDRIKSGEQNEVMRNNSLFWRRQLLGSSENEPPDYLALYRGAFYWRTDAFVVPVLNIEITDKIIIRIGRKPDLFS